MVKNKFGCLPLHIVCQGDVAEPEVMVQHLISYYEEGAQIEDIGIEFIKYSRHFRS